MQRQQPMRVAYADPPYPGMSGFYKDHPDYAGEVDHAELVERLMTFDGWVLHTASTTLKQVLEVCPPDVRVGAWVKPFASFKKTVRVAYAWEPVIFWGGRERSVIEPTIRDWCSEPMLMKAGLTGAKPGAVCRWLFDVLGLRLEDDLVDLFPGSGSVTAAWDAFCSAPRLGMVDYDHANVEPTIPMEDVA